MLSPHEFFARRPRGVGLVVVLSVLVVLALIAATLAVLVQIETSAAASSVNRGSLHLLMDNGIAHALAVLDTPLPASSASVGAQDALLARQFGDERKEAPPWFNVLDSRGILVGRYRIRIEDEAKKANLNAACLTAPSKGSGWNPSEINLAQALRVPPSDAARIVAFRYGNDGKPGIVNVDDDRNNPILMSDGIDNNANGLVDEEGEGIDDPGEYTLHHLFGDDRMFCGMGDAANIMLGQMHFSTPAERHEARRSFLGSATVYSEDQPGSPTLPADEPADVNCMTAREARRRIDLANQSEPFEPIASRRTQLALNIVDYRDQNHVLSTMGSVYGVEAVCFNEVLAYDASILIKTDEGSWLPNWDGNIIKDWWETSYGVLDPADETPRVYTKKRIAFNIMAAYATCVGDPEQSFDPVKLWHVRPGVVSGSRFVDTGGSLEFTLPDVPGDTGQGSPHVFTWLAPYPALGDLPGAMKWGNQGSWYPRNDYPTLNGSGDKCTLLYNHMMDVLRKRGKAQGGHPKVPDNLFVNSLAMIYMWNRPDRPIGSFEVTSSHDHTFSAKGSDAFTGKSFKQLSSLKYGDYTNNLSISFAGWGYGAVSTTPRANGLQMFHLRKKMPNRYFKVVFSRNPCGAPPPAHDNETQIDNNKVVHTLGLSGTPQPDTFSTETAKTWDYKDGEPIRTDPHGWLDVMYAASPEVNSKTRTGQALGFIRLIAPEVVEMYNASDKPVSLANWRVICNTGSLATEIGRIKRTSYYDAVSQKPLMDDNPCVSPRGYFYLVNDTRLFDTRYGNADFFWGSGPAEQIPVFQMDEQHWGVSYTIEKVKEIGWTVAAVTVKNEKWEPDMFKFETVQFFCPDDANDDQSWNGAIFPVRDMGENWFSIGVSGYRPNLPKPGSKVMILGLPYKGGIVSLTLKDQYEQVCGRTIDYGRLAMDEIDYSAEKSDPTHYTWIKQHIPSIGGTARQAKNRALSNRATEPSSIKDAAYGSVGELRHVSTSTEFETLGDSGSKSRRLLSMAALANTFCASSLRLEAMDANAVRTGWQDASAAVDSWSDSTIRAKDAHWQPNQWRGQILRFTSGPLRNQMFPVFANSPDTLYLSMTNSQNRPLSAPDRMALKPQRDDLFSLGPGYVTACAYSRTSNQKGEWLWKHRVPSRGNYQLYIYGLSDAIATTEFLEENNNAPLDVEVWNWDTSTFDMLCQRQRYRKEDCIAVGTILPAHVSQQGDFKIRITAHDVEQFQQLDTSGKTVNASRSSGFAWFNFAMLSPAPVVGRVNVNTASARLLASLPGVTQNLAVAIAAGIDSTGRPRRKPYRGPGDLLSVAGMNLDIFERIANLVCVNGNAYTIDVEAQVVSDIHADGLFDESKGDRVLAQRRRRSVLVRTPDTTPARHHVAERYDP